jgi:NAD(P)-dependent dehydrogenase (short-subunit alcohol dehydrogenase family)
MRNLAGRIAVVTGCTGERGGGRGVVRRLVAAGGRSGPGAARGVEVDHLGLGGCEPEEPAIIPDGEEHAFPR